MKSLIFSYLLLLSSFVLALDTPKEIFVEVGGDRIFCKVMGQGDPLLVIHGGPGLTHDYLFPELSKLAKTHFVVFYDQRGFGLSTGEINLDTMKLDVFIEDIESLRSFFGFDKMIVLGHSWGGLLTMKYALTHPESVDKMILLNSLPASFEDCFTSVMESMKILTPYQEQLRAIEESEEFKAGDPDTFKKYFRMRAGAGLYDPRKADLLDVPLSLKGFNDYLKAGELVFHNMLLTPFNWYEGLKRLNLSTLIVHGDVDFIPMEKAQKVHESIPSSEYVLLEKCGHCPVIEKPEELLHHLDVFLNDR